jgi:hypothetical protein
MTALLAARQRCEIHRSGAEIEKNRIVKSQYAGPIRIADHMVARRDHTPSVTFVSEAHHARADVGPTAPRERKRTELSARRGCGPMIASAPLHLRHTEGVLPPSLADGCKIDQPSSFR